MSAIEAATAGFKDMADGTVRFFFDVEPRHAGAALELFRARGTPAALAALRVGYLAVDEPKVTEQAPEPEPIATKPKGGVLARLAGMWCADPEFWGWINSTTHNGIMWPTATAVDAADFVREICGVDSRAELDNSVSAARLFHSCIRGPFSKYLAARGITT